jgi:prophage maintenance system killer protein
MSDTNSTNTGNGTGSGSGNTSGANSLRRQLEMTRFDRAMEVAESLADHRALLTTAELARMNNILIGKTPENEPWREKPVTITLPSGRTETLALIADPKVTAREKLHHATELAENGAAIDAAVDIYAALVLSHVFEDANRRTAALAAHYFLRRYGAPISGLALHEIGLGDLREEGQIESLRETVTQMAKFAKKAKK